MDDADESLVHADEVLVTAVGDMLQANKKEVADISKKEKHEESALTKEENLVKLLTRKLAKATKVVAKAKAQKKVKAVVQPPNSAENSVKKLSLKLSGGLAEKKALIQKMARNEAEAKKYAKFAEEAAQEAEEKARNAEAEEQEDEKELKEAQLEYSREEYETMKKAINKSVQKYYGTNKPAHAVREEKAVHKIKQIIRDNTHDDVHIKKTIQNTLSKYDDENNKW